VCGLGAEETRKVTRWAAEALVAQAMAGEVRSSGRPRQRAG